jgi:predicted nucleic acid-binding protein
MVSMVRGEVGVKNKSNFEVLIDSDAFIAFYLDYDLFHPQASELFARFDQSQTGLTTTSWVVAETATVLSYRGGQELAQTFLQRIKSSHIPVIHIDEKLEQATFQFFKNQKGRGISMVDCANAVVTQHFSIPEIFSFDKFYKQLNLKIVL